MRRISLSLLLLGLVGVIPAYSQTPNNLSAKELDKFYRQYPYVENRGKLFNIESEFMIPDGYSRMPDSRMTKFQAWVSRMPLWHYQKGVATMGQGLAFEAYEISRCVMFPWRTSKMFEYVVPMQIQLEWLLKEKRADKWLILPVAGDTMSYPKWLVSSPVYDSRMRLKLEPSDPRIPDSLEYNRFFNLVAENSNYLSLEQNSDSVTEADLRPGDFYIARSDIGTSGRVLIVLCILQNKQGERLYLIGSGGNPPSDFYIPLANNDRNNPWLALDQVKAMAPAELPHRGFYRLRMPR